MAAEVLKPLFGWRSALVDSGLSAAEKHVALTLSLHMSERGESCFPKLTTLARETSRGRSTIAAALAGLEANGWLKVERDPGKSNRYTAKLPVQPQDWHTTLDPSSLGTGARPASGPEVESKTLGPPSSSTQSGAPAPSAHKLMGEAIRAACFGAAHKLTGREGQQVGLAVNELVAIDADPLDVARFAEAYRRSPTYRECALTPLAIAGHWNELLPARAERVAPCPECEQGGGRHLADCSRALPPPSF